MSDARPNATGQLRPTQVNLQNIPIHTELGRVIRDKFLPRHDGKPR